MAIHLGLFGILVCVESSSNHLCERKDCAPACSSCQRITFLKPKARSQDELCFKRKKTNCLKRNKLGFAKDNFIHSEAIALKKRGTKQVLKPHRLYRTDGPKGW
uniref:Putative secreted protein n=1 Tax=Rhipicephalus microplus TaxID=6941 RepID=A0A6M2DCY5_RHIMP